MHPLPRAMLAASLGGLPLLAGFFVWHWYRIAPVWNVIWEGLVFVAIVGAAVGWAWHEARGRLPGGVRGGLAFGAVFASMLIVYEVVGLLKGPTPDPTSLREVLTALPGALMAVPLGAAAGWWIVRSGRGAGAFALAAGVLHLMFGGAIWHAGGVGIALDLFALVFPLEILAGVVLAVADGRLAR